MAGLPTIAGCMRVAFSWRSTGSTVTAVNVMHFGSASTDTLALKNALDTNVTSSMWLQCSTAAGIYQLAITPLDGTTATQLYTVSGTKWSGTQPNNDFQPATAVVLSLRTAVRGRQNRGRIFLPFVQETVTTTSTYSGTIATQQAAWDTFRTAMKTASFPMQVASYGHGYHRHKNPDGSILMSPVTWTAHANEVTSTLVESALGTMRPRQSRLR